MFEGVTVIYFKSYFRDNKLPKGLNQILHSFMMTTSADLNAKENIAVMHFMENEVLRLATRKEFTGILTTNTSPLTQVRLKKKKHSIVYYIY